MTSTLLFYHCGDAWIRGSEVVLLNVMARLDRDRYRPLLVCDQEVLAAAARDRIGMDAEVLRIPEIMWEEDHRRFELGAWLSTVRRLRQIIAAEDVSLFYCNSALPSQTGYFAARSAGIPMVCHIHAPYTRRYAWLYRFHRADAVIFVSRFVRSLLEGKVAFRNPPLVVHNGVDTEKYSPVPRDPSFRERLGIPADRLIVGQTGSLIRRKEAGVAIRAVAEPGPSERDVRLVLVGDGQDGPEFEALAAELGVADRVVFAGHQRDTVSWYRHVFDVNLLASSSEAMGLALLEGAACGIPGIGANAEGTPEALVEGESGFLFPAGDHVELARLMVRFADDPGLRRSMGHRAREVALERFSVGRQIAEIEAIIAGLIAGSESA